MFDLHHTIQHHLNTAYQPDSLHNLFCHTLWWNDAPSNGQQLFACGANQEDVIAQPLAQLGGVRVFRIDWMADALPSVAHRHAVHRALAPVGDHLVCYVTPHGRKLAIVWAFHRQQKQVEQRTLTYKQHTTARTTIERLALLAVTAATVGIDVRERIKQAFDVDSLTRQFLACYRTHFNHVERCITGIDHPARRRLFTQKLFNRLLCLLFLEQKEWLLYNGRTDYVRALWDAHIQELVNEKKPHHTFYTARLKPLFCLVFNRQDDANVTDNDRHRLLALRVGLVPSLAAHGGLFDEELDDLDDDGIIVPDMALQCVIQELFYAFNMTMCENTPSDSDVAIDPEMLGNMFETFITERHKSGSYYTPRPVVSFMCREGLKGYLTHCLQSETPTAIARFVDEHTTNELHNPNALLNALRVQRVCDPACGSGAYLLGMLHEIFSLRTLLCTTYNIDVTTPYNRKLDIIQSNLYGVDKDPFAVTIARLRLWLALVADDNSNTPPPLPHRNNTLQVGDSLTSFDWRTAFADIFAAGGFDIVVGNPPYVRQELITNSKPLLKLMYPDVYTGTADVYVYFYARALHVLKQGGMLCYISSNTFFRAGFGSKLRDYLAHHTTITQLIDFGDTAVFTAGVNTCIMIARNKAPHAHHHHHVCWLKWDSHTPVTNIATEFHQRHSLLAQTYFTADGWRLERTTAMRLFNKLYTTGKPLGVAINRTVYRGILTGCNRALIVNHTTRDMLIAQHAASAELLRPILRGRDVKRWHIAFAKHYLIAIASSNNKTHPWTGQAAGDAERTFANTYPAVHTWLERSRDRLIKRADQGTYFWELRSCQFWHNMAQPKIVYPDIACSASFAYDEQPYAVEATLFFMPTQAVWLVGLFNSTVMRWIYARMGAQLGGNGIRYKTQYMLHLPIPPATPQQQAAIEHIVQRILAIKRATPHADVSALEAEIDDHVFALYGITREERHIIAEG